MRVAIVTETYPQLSETFIRRHAESLGADVVALYRNPTLTFERETSTGRIYALHTQPRSPERFFPKVVRRLKETVSDIRVPPWPPEMEAYFDRYVEERRPDVVLAEFAPNALQALDGCRHHGIPLVTHFHGYDASAMLRYRGYVSQLPELCRDSAAIVAVSTHMAETLAKLECPKGKLSIIPCGAPIERTLPSLERKEGCHFITVGRMTSVKGPLFTLRAFAHCYDTEKSVSLTMIGDGPLLKPALRLVRRLRIEHKVTFLGRQPFRIVANELRQSHVCLQHNITTRLGQVEGWGVAVAEAQAVGLPVIGTDHGGLPDQIVHGETGYLVPEGDWRAMGERMIHLARDPELRERMGRAARVRIIAVGDLAKQIRKLETLLRDCVPPSAMHTEAR